MDDKKHTKKSKSGKIITKNNSVNKIQPAQKVNVILHMKCFIRDLNEQENQIKKIITDEYTYNPTIPPEIVAYNKNDQDFFFIDPVVSGGGENRDEGTPPPTTGVVVAPTMDIEINEKLKKLKISLYKDVMDEKKSACFWCSYEYENPSCYIPKYDFENSIQAYGSFCTPECAAGFLINEDIDDSIIFERYYLLNQIYGKIYNYEKNIKPAPNPFYLLDKYYGNLSIAEYRALTRTDKTFTIIDKPMTRILPELHEEKDRAITSSCCTGIYRVKRQSDSNKQSKNNIIRENFGVT
jgi:hypothetical protein